MNNRRSRRLAQVAHIGLLGVLVPLALGAAGPVIGATAATEPAAEVLGEVVVTAQKREENIQNVGISIAAFGEDQLRNMGVTSTDQLAGMVPGVQIFQFGQQATTTISVRGVSQNDFADHNEAPVAVYQDGAYNSFIGGAGLALFDIERVEILRGPQGTLFGRNATGGLVQLITRKPSQDFDAYAQVTGGRFGMRQIEGAIGGGLTDTVSARLAVQATQDDGTVRNVSGPRKQRTDNLSARLQLDFKPSDALDVLWKLHGVTDNVNGTVAYKPRRAVQDANGNVVYPTSQQQYADWCTNPLGPAGAFAPSAASVDCFDATVTNPSDPWTVASDFRGVMKRRMYGSTLTVNWTVMHDVTFTSISDYLKLNRNYTEDTDGTDLSVFNFASDMHSHQLSQEFRLAGKSDRFAWQTGLYYLDIEHDILTGADSEEPFTGLGEPLFLTSNHNDQSTKSYSVFGQVDWALSPKWNLTTGVRYVRDRKSINIDPTCTGFICSFALDQSPVTGIPFVQGVGFNDGNAGGLNHKTYSDVAGKVELDYRPHEGLMTYLSVNRGIKGGGFNAAAIAAIPLSLVSYKPEVLTAFELGSKWTFWEERARLNGSVFYYDYKDYQAFTLTGVSPFVFNTDAKTKGGEMELTVVPVKGLNVTVGAAYLDALAKNVPISIDHPESARDQRPPQSPKWTFDASVRQTWALPGGSSLAAQITANYVASRFFNTVNHPALEGGSYTVENLRLSYSTAEERWEAAIFVNNLSNEKYVTTAFDMSGTNGTIAQVFAPPRQVGASVKVRFGK